MRGRKAPELTKTLGEMTSTLLLPSPCVRRIPATHNVDDSPCAVFELFSILTRARFLKTVKGAIFNRKIGQRPSVAPPRKRRIVIANDWVKNRSTKGFTFVQNLRWLNVQSDLARARVTPIPSASRV